jgi:hypothetical protein
MTLTSKHWSNTTLKAYGIKAGTAAEMLVLVGDTPDRIPSEGALAKLCGACPIPASSSKVTHYRLNRGGNRQANAAPHRVVRMRGHQPTIDYVRRRTAEGKSKPEIIRCLKRFVVREIFGPLCRPLMPEPSAKMPIDVDRSINARRPDDAHRQHVRTAQVKAIAADARSKAAAMTAAKTGTNSPSATTLSRSS